MRDNAGAVLDRLILFLHAAAFGDLLVILVNSVVEVNRQSVSQPLTEEKKCE